MILVIGGAGQGKLSWALRFTGLPADQAVVPVVVMAAWAVVCTAVAVRFFKWE